MPEDVLSGLKRGEDENVGKLFLTFKYPDLFPTMKYALSPETRRRVRSTLSLQIELNNDLRTGVLG